MKIRKILFTTIFLAVCWMMRAQDTLIVSLDEPGTLEAQLTQISQSARYNTASLTVLGPVNGADMMFIRDMCGVKNLNTPTAGILSSLDLGDASVVTSDEPYITVYDTDYTTHPDEFGPFFLYNCKSLTELTLPKDIVAVDTMAFAGCENLQSLELPGTLNYIGMGAFLNCNSIKRLNVPNEVTELGVGAFQRMNGLEELTLGNGITEIENSIVVLDTSLKIINLGFRFRTFDPIVFYNTPSLQQINVNEYNPYYVSLDGVLFSTGSDTLVTFPAAYPAEQYEIPEGVRHIAPYAFMNAAQLQQVVMPATVGVVDTLAFFGCSQLKEVLGAKGLTTLRFGAFGMMPGEEGGLASFLIPSTLSMMEGGAFLGNTMVMLEVDPDNPYYVSDEQGLVYTSDLSKLCLVPGISESVSLPASVSTIGEYAFSTTHVLTEINLPYVTTICDEAFAFALGVETIILGNYINKVGAQVVDYCTSLKDLYVFADDIPDENLHEFAFLDETGTAMEQCVLHVKPGKTIAYLTKRGFYSEEYEMFFFADITEIEDPDAVGQMTTHVQSPSYFGIDGIRKRFLSKGLNIISLPGGVNIKKAIK